MFSQFLVGSELFNSCESYELRCYVPILSRNSNKVFKAFGISIILPARLAEMNLKLRVVLLLDQFTLILCSLHWI